MSLFRRLLSSQDYSYARALVLQVQDQLAQGNRDDAGTWHCRHNNAEDFMRKRLKNGSKKFVVLPRLGFLEVVRKHGALMMRGLCSPPRHPGEQERPSMSSPFGDMAEERTVQALA